MIQHITKPFKEFFKLEASSGIVLLIAAILALIISNGSYSEDYFSILKKYITLGTESFGLKLSVLQWINDVLMAVFFFFVSLEIKREFFEWELSNRKSKNWIPLFAAMLTHSPHSCFQFVTSVAIFQLSISCIEELFFLTWRNFIFNRLYLTMIHPFN